MATNSDREMRWVEAWDDLLDITHGRQDISCLLPDGTVVGVEECKGWLQDSAYLGFLVRVQPGWVAGRPGVVANRWAEDSGPT